MLSFQYRDRLTNRLHEENSDAPRDLNMREAWIHLAGFADQLTLDQ